MTEINTVESFIAPDKVKQIALVGTGKIGAAWAAHFLAQGLDVIATDPNPDAEEKLRAVVDNAWPFLEQLGLAKEASRERLRFTTSMETAVKNADFIQESTPERHDIKDQVMTAISQAARPDIVIASSASGLVATRLQEQCQHPERMLVGHPINPVYLIPLVEVVGGQKTSAQAIEWTMAFYQRWGKTPLHCRVETPGHLVNHLQDSMITEAMQLVADNIASTAELDAALSEGLALRWALMGSMLTANMSCEGGLRDVLSGHFGDLSSSTYSHFKGPELNEDIIERLATGAELQAAGRSLQEMEKMRDEFLVGLLKLRADIENKYGFNRSRFITKSLGNEMKK